MAKVLPNNAVISNDDEWVWNGEEWLQTSNVTGSKKPDRVQTDHARMLSRATSSAECRAAAEELIRTIGHTGSLQAARRFLAERRDLQEASRPVGTAADQWEEVEIDPEILVKTYNSSKEFAADSPELIRKGWQPQVQTGIGGHINVGRTASAAVLTGGLSLLAGASRTKDQLTVTWVRRRTERRLVTEEPSNASASQSPGTDIAATITKLADLHAQGVLTDQEFAAKKADLLARM